MCLTGSRGPECIYSGRVHFIFIIFEVFTFSSSNRIGRLAGSLISTEINALIVLRAWESGYARLGGAVYAPSFLYLIQLLLVKDSP